MRVNGFNIEARSVQKCRIFSGSTAQLQHFFTIARIHVVEHPRMHPVPPGFLYKPVISQEPLQQSCLCPQSLSMHDFAGMKTNRHY